MNYIAIGKAARKSGVGVETIRVYERWGLIEQPRKTDGAGFRVYPVGTVQRMHWSMPVRVRP